MKKIILAIALFSVINFNQPLAYSTPTNPTTISYQGVLTDGNDDLLADGEHSVTFKLYDVLSNGSALWTETQTVSTTNGLFNVDLGSVTGVTGVDFTKQLYLEVTVESIVLSPRIKFTAQPYAFMAKSLTETLPLANGGTGATTAEGARTNLQLGSLAVEDFIGNDMWTGDPLSVENGGTGTSSIEELQTSLGLGELAYLESVSNDYWSGEDLAIENGGTGASTVEDARTNLGLGSLALEDNVDDNFWSGEPLSVINGGTGANDLETAQANLGITTLQSDVTDLETEISALGTISTQAASSVAITGGTVNGTSVGATSASTGKFTSTETGTLKVTGGTPGTGKVLTSDANGTATWADAASGGTINLATGVTGTLPLANGGTGSTTAAGARTNLELGTISTQAASSVAITGGTVNGTSVGATTASTGKFTSTETGTLKVTGGTDLNGKVLTADASGNATWQTASGGGSSTVQGYSVCTETKTVTNSTTMIDVPGLSVEWGANKAGTYIVRFTVSAETVTSSLSYQLTKLGSGTVSNSLISRIATNVAPVAINTSNAFFGSGSTQGFYEVVGYLEIDNNVTGIKFQFAQTSSSAGTASIKIGSFVTYEKID